jgi:Flp pilus assembly protein TadD
MPPSPTSEPMPVDRYGAAATVLERAGGAASADPAVAYLLFLAYKRQGKTAEARTALRKIAKPDANVTLQMGLLSLAENNLAQAEGEFSRAWAMDPMSYVICYNLLLTQLTLGKLEPCLELIPRAVELLGKKPEGVARPADDRRFLQILGALLRAGRSNAIPADDLLSEITPADEKRLLDVVRSLGQLDTTHSLLRVLSEARPRSAPVREAYVESALVKAKDSLDRCQWTEVELLLKPMSRERGFSKPNQIALLNLLGCCVCQTQDYESAAAYFQQALKLAGHDARLHQNLALTYELQGSLGEADPHWNRFFDLLGDQVPIPPEMPKYIDQLAHECMNRLATKYAEKEKWNSAISYLQKATQMKGADPEAMERLFHLYQQAKRPNDARRTLDQMRKLRPGEPQYELYELDLIEVKSLNDIEKLITEIDRIRQRHPGDARVEDRAVGMVGNIIPLMGNLCDNLTDQMTRVVDQIRSLPDYQINWSAVREVMRDLIKEFQKLRRITGKCMPLVNGEEHRRIVRDLADHIDKKIEACRSMGA